MKQIEMKKNTLYAIATLLTLSLFFVACNDDDLVNGPAPKEGDCIKFSVGGKNSRTVYNEDDPWQIDWLQDGTDKIRIYSAEARKGDGTNKVSADYSVTPYKTTVPGQTINGTTIADYVSYKNGWLEPNESGLEWGAADMHYFYAVYPADDSKLAGYEYESGIITFNYNSNQKCTLTGSSKTENGITVYTTNPDMSNAYMVAKASANKNTYSEKNPIELQFEPIMTTLHITVRGTDQEAIPVQITGVSIICEFDEERTVVNDGQFKYDIDFSINHQNEDIYPNANGGIVTGSNGVKTLTTYVGITDGTNNFIKLSGPNQAVKITAFVPPIVLQSNYTSIQVHYSGDFITDTDGNGNTIGGNGVLKTCLSKDGKKPTQENAQNAILVPAGNKRRITLPIIKTPLTNNWITPLDDDIYVSQLSIPGTHDAATGDGTTFRLGQTQELNLADQWTLGIRCFDLRPTYRTGNDTKYGNNLWIYHGAVATTWSMDGAVNLLKTKLEENPGEFAIVIMRHETEGDNSSDSWPGEMAKALASYKNLKNSTTGEGLTVDFKPDLTIEECRGKILFMMRSWTSYTGGPTVGGYHDWSHDAAAVECNIWGPSSPTGKLYVQDYYNLDLGFTFRPDYTASSGDAIYDKQNAICDMLDLSAKSHTEDSYKNTWYYNHASGYIYYTIGDVGVSTTDGYRGNAKNNHPLIYNYLLGNEVIINGKKRKKDVGSAGIILMDFVGVASSANIQVNGHLCPQVIIDNNYKYHLKRKGENSE